MDFSGTAAFHRSAQRIPISFQRYRSGSAAANPRSSVQVIDALTWSRVSRQVVEQPRRRDLRTVVGSPATSSSDAPGVSCLHRSRASAPRDEPHVRRCPHKACCVLIVAIARRARILDGRIVRRSRSQAVRQFDVQRNPQLSAVSPTSTPSKAWSDQRNQISKGRDGGTTGR